MSSIRRSRDSIHISSTKPPTLSVHAVWRNKTCKADKAVVTVWLERLENDGRWHSVGDPGRATVKSVTKGIPSSQRANARYTCRGAQRNTYRSVVDVDVVGVRDDPKKSYSGTQAFNCA